VKVKPIKETVVTNWPVLVQGLKEMIEALNVDIDIREKKLHEQADEIERLNKNLENAVATGQTGSTAKEKSNLGKTRVDHIRKRSVLPGNLALMLGDVSDLQKEAEIFDEMDTADVDEFEIEAEMKQGIDNSRGEKEAVAAVLGIEKEEFIRKSTIFTQTSIEKFRQTRNEQILNMSEDNQKAEVFTKLGVNQDSGTSIDYEQDHMATDNLTRDQLVERCEVLESMLDAEKALNESYLYSQQVIIDHLAETNEGLLTFFRVKFKLLDKGKKESGKKGKKKKKSPKH